MDGRYVNGVDMITCDADGRIIDFKVMVRPLQAVEAVREGCWPRWSSSTSSSADPRRFGTRR